MGERKVLIGAKVPSEIHQKLVRLAELRGIDVADIIRMAVLKELAEAGLLPTEQARALGVAAKAPGPGPETQAPGQSPHSGDDEVLPAEASMKMRGQLSRADRARSSELTAKLCDGGWDLDWEEESDEDPEPTCADCVHYDYHRKKCTLKNYHVDEDEPACEYFEWG